MVLKSHKKNNLEDDRSILMNEVLENYNDSLPENYPDTSTKNIEHKIDLKPDSKPKFRPIYKLSFSNLV